MFCLLSDSKSIFLNYTQKACLFECTVRQAIDKADCLPWDYPIPKLSWSKDLRVCLNNLDSNEIQAFNAAMDEADTKVCDCMPDCEGVTYDIQVDRIKLPPPNELCKNEVSCLLAQN